MKQFIANFNMFLNERKAQEIPHKKNQWVEINPADYEDLKDDFFELVKIAYESIGGNLQVKKPADLFDQGISVFKAVDVDGDKDFDVMKGYKETPYGKKSILMGRDESKEAKKSYLDKMGEELNKKGYYVEVSHKLAEILMNKYHVHVVTNPKAIETVLGKHIEFHGEHPTDKNATGNGWYTRKIGDNNAVKILVGRPLVKESVVEGLKAMSYEVQPKLLILHGYESSHNPPRVEILRDLGFKVFAEKIDYDSRSSAIFNKYLNLIREEKIDLIVGSSMGGYLGFYLAKATGVPAIVFNPALIETSSGAPKPIVNVNGSQKPKIIVVTGLEDDVVNSENLIEWLKENTGSNVKIEKERIGHRIPDKLYIDYILGEGLLEEYKGKKDKKLTHYW